MAIHNMTERVPSAQALLPWQNWLVCYLCGLYSSAEATVAVLACLLCILLGVRGKQVVLAGFCFAVGYWVGLVPMRPNVEADWFGQTVFVHGIIEDVTTYPGGRVGIVVADVETAEGRVLPGRMLWSWDAPPEVPESGQKFRGEFKIRPMHGRENFGLASADTRWAREHVWTRTFTKGAGQVTWENSAAPSLRATMIATVDSLAPSGAGGAVIRALLFGDRFKLSPAFVDQIRRGGLSHMLALSGLNLGLAAALGYALAWVPGFLYPRLYLYIPRQKLGALLAFPPVLMYTWMGDFAPSLQRSAIMLVVAAGTLLLGRARSVQDALFVAVAMLVLMDPGAAYDVSLQLSVLAVLGIVLFMPYAQLRLACFASGWKRCIHVPGMLLAVTLCANVMILPLQAYYFGEFSPHLYLNLVWPAVVDILVLPLSFAGLVLAQGLGLDSAASLCFAAAAWAVELLADCLAYLDAHRLLNAWPLFRPLWMQSLGYYIVLISFAAGARRMMRERRERLVLLLALLLLCWPTLLEVGRDRNRVELTVLDTGMSQSLFIRNGTGHTVLLDGGGSWSTDYDIGRAVVGPALAWNHLPCVDTVLLSHVDADHIRGLYHILRSFDVGSFDWTGLLDDSAESIRIREVLAEERFPVRVLSGGDTLMLGPDLWLEILHPQRGEYTFSDNESSLVARLVWKGRGLAMLPGDAEKNSLDRLARSGSSLDADVLVLPHHGSRSGFAPEFLRRVGFKWVVAACGFENRFGFPHAEVREHCDTHGQLLTTAEHGAVRFTWKEDGSLEMRTARDMVQP